MCTFVIRTPCCEVHLLNLRLIFILIGLFLEQCGKLLFIHVYLALLYSPLFITNTLLNKKLSYCWETVRRESMPRIAEMDVEMTT